MRYKGVLAITLRQEIIVEAESRSEAIKAIERKIESTNYDVLAGPFFQFLEAHCFEIQEEENKDAAQNQR